MLPDIETLKLFEGNQIKVYGSEQLSDSEVEYDHVSFEFESLNLGDPIEKEVVEDEDQEQITPDILNPDGSFEEPVDTNINEGTYDREQEYEVPEVKTSTIEDLSSDDIKETIETTSSRTVTSDMIEDVDFNSEYDLF